MREARSVEICDRVMDIRDILYFDETHEDGSTLNINLPGRFVWRICVNDRLVAIKFFPRNQIEMSYKNFLIEIKNVSIVITITANDEHVALLSAIITPEESAVIRRGITEMLQPNPNKDTKFNATQLWWKSR